MNNRYFQHPDADSSDLFADMDDDFDDDLWDDDSFSDDAVNGSYAQPAPEKEDSDARNAYSGYGGFWDDGENLSAPNEKRSAPARSAGTGARGSAFGEGKDRQSSLLFRTGPSGRRLLSVPVLILIDCALIGCSLLIFALFHHVIPRSQAPEGSYVSTISPSDFSDMFAPVSGSEVSGSEVSGSDAEQDGKNLPFTQETIVTDTSYHSSNVAVTVTTYTEKKLVYHVQDIYVRSPEYFRTAFAKDTYGVWITEETPAIAERNNAICAINGDYYGASSKKGLVVRNGVFYRGNGNDTDDILVLLADGSMEVYTAQNYNEEALLRKNIWQTWSFGPSLLDENGHAIKEFDSEIAGENPRTAVGYFEPGHYCFISVEGRSKESQGLSFADLAALCESLGCKIAYNLDGGKTSMMTFGDRLVNDAYHGGRECSDILYICDPSAE